MSLRAGTFNDPTNPLSSLSGTSTSNAFLSGYAILTGYWETDTSGDQYFIWNEEITGATGYYISGSDPYQWDVLGTYTLSSVTAAGGLWITYITDSVPSNLQRFVFGTLTGGSVNFGYSSFTTGGSPVGDYNGARPNLTSRWNTMLSNINVSTFLVNSDMTGNDGWLTRLWNPYLGFKKLMMLNNDVLYDVSGWWMSGISSFPCGTPNNLAPISSYANAYQVAYNNIDEFIMGYQSIFTGATATCAYVSSYYIQYYNSAITGGWSNAGAGAQNAEARMTGIGDAGAGADPKFLFTGDDEAICTDSGYEYDMPTFRTNNLVYSLQQQYDSSAYNLPPSGYQGTSERIWDEGARRVLHLALINYTPFDVIRDFIPSAS